MKSETERILKKLLKYIKIARGSDRTTGIYMLVEDGGRENLEKPLEQVVSLSDADKKEIADKIEEIKRAKDNAGSQIFKRNIMPEILKIVGVGVGIGVAAASGWKILKKIRGVKK